MSQKRKSTETESDKPSAERVKIKQGLDEARSVFERGGDLPAYLVKALIRYEAAFWAGVERRVIMPKLVQRAHAKGLPLSKQSTSGASAYEVAADKTGVSMSTVERAYSEYPPDPDEAATRVKRGPVLASKWKGKSSKR